MPAGELGMYFHDIRFIHFAMSATNGKVQASLHKDKRVQRVFTATSDVQQIFMLYGLHDCLSFLTFSCTTRQTATIATARIQKSILL